MRRLSRANSAIIGCAALRTIRNWQLSDADACAILGMHPAHYGQWKSGGVGRIPENMARRICLLIKIRLALRAIFTEPDRAYAWLSRPNDVFGGAAPLALIRQGDLRALIRVQAYLQAEIQLW